MLAPFILLATAPLSAFAADVLKTTGYTLCQDDSEIKVNRMDIEFDKATKKVTFDVSGTSLKKQEVMATLVVNAYGIEVYKNEFDPCKEDTKVPQLCPGERRRTYVWSQKLTMHSSRRHIRCPRYPNHP